VRREGTGHAREQRFRILELLSVNPPGLKWTKIERAMKTRKVPAAGAMKSSSTVDRRMKELIRDGCIYADPDTRFYHLLPKGQKELQILEVEWSLERMIRVTPNPIEELLEIFAEYLPEDKQRRALELLGPLLYQFGQMTERDLEAESADFLRTVRTGEGWP